MQALGAEEVPWMRVLAKACVFLQSPRATIAGGVGGLNVY